MKKAIIVWVGWQDGTIMHNFLKSKEYSIVWISKDKTLYDWIAWWNKSINILDKEQVVDLIKTYMPDEIYYLAAYHHSSQDIIPSDDIVFKESNNVHINWYFNILQAVAKYSPASKICYASSCLIYAWSDTQQQDETTLPAPNSIYAITKLEGMHLGNRFAEKYNIQIINAILYNHESELRSSNFVFMKIIQGAINIAQWIQDSITLWDISTQVDWGYAYDYVEAMYKLLQSDKKWDYVVSSWHLHTIQEVVEIVFDYFKLDTWKYIKIDKKIIHRKKWILFGNNGKILKDLWRNPKIGFKEMIISIIMDTIPFIKK